MAENRDSREEDTRESGERQQFWKPPELLPEPKRQAGYEYRWIRVATLGDVDATNVSSKLREGWEPCKAKDHPEIFLAAIEQPRFKDNIVIGGLMLCKAPSEMVAQRKEYYEKQTQSQMHSVDNNLMNESDERMPIFNERETKVTFGSGN
jgi:hypothetical protein